MTSLVACIGEHLIIAHPPARRSVGFGGKLCPKHASLVRNATVGVLRFKMSLGLRQVCM